MFIDDLETEGIPERILLLMRALEIDTMLDICRRIQATGRITRTADYQLERLKHLSAFRDNYEKMIKKILLLSDKELNKLYKEVIAEGYARDKTLYDYSNVNWIPFEKNKSLQQLISSVMTQTQNTLTNITKTTGFIDLANNKFVNLNQYFINILDKTHLEISTGTFSYDQALYKAVSDMAKGGLRWVNYNNIDKKPWHNRIDVAARRAVMTGIAQVEGHIAEENARQLNTEYFEVSAHATARPSHMLWQGRVYTKEQLKNICGLGTGEGLLGWNCYHHYDAFIPGISVRKYSDEQLAELRNKSIETKEYKGKKYTLYEATQRQRDLETRMRASNARISMLKEGGASREVVASEQTKRESIYNEYKDFSNYFGLPEQINRVYTGINTKEIDVKASDANSQSGNLPAISLVNARPSINSQDMGKLVDMNEKEIIPNAISNIKEWQPINGENSQVPKILDSYVINGVEYFVDGKYVVSDPKPNDLRVASLLASKYGKIIKVVPRVLKPERKNTPDYLVGNEEIKYDLKTPDKYGGIFNRVNKGKKQSKHFIIDISNLSDYDKCVEQVAKIFTSKFTDWVIEIVIVRYDKIIASFKRKI